MLFEKRFVAILAMTSVVVASPYTKRDDVEILNDLISNAAVSISNIVNSATLLTQAGPSPTLGDSLSSQIDELANTYEKLSDNLGDATHLSSDFATDPRVIAINNGFSTLLSDTIANLSTIAQSPNVTQAQGQVLFNALPALADTLDSFSSAFPGVNVRNYINNIGQTLAASGKGQATAFGNVGSFVQGVSDTL